VPARPGGRREQRLGRHVEVQRRAVVDHEQPVVAAVAEVAQHEAPVVEHRGVEAAGRHAHAGARAREHRVAPPQRDQVAVQPQRGLVPRARALVPVEHAPPERGRVVRHRHHGLHVVLVHRRELRHLGEPPLLHERRELGVVVGEVLERRRRRPLLPLEEHGRLRAQQQRRGHRAQRAGRAHLVQPLAHAGVGHLVVVLEEVHEAPRRDAERRRAAPPPLPLVPLPLVEEAVLRRRHELARRAAVVGEVRLVAQREPDVGAVVPVVVPDRVEVAPALGGGGDERGALRLVLVDDPRRAPPSRPAAARTAAPSSASTCTGDASTMACVASSRSPSTRNSSTQ
jgi:hypothetical protein